MLLDIKCLPCNADATILMHANQLLQQHVCNRQADIALTAFSFASEWKISSRIAPSAIARLQGMS